MKLISLLVGMLLALPALAQDYPIAGITLGAQIVMVRNDLPAKTIQEFIALAKAQPGKLSFGSGNGSSRGGAELFRIMTKIDLLGVPYKTQPQAVYGRK